MNDASAVLYVHLFLAHLSKPVVHSCPELETAILLVAETMGNDCQIFGVETFQHAIKYDRLIAFPYLFIANAFLFLHELEKAQDLIYVNDVKLLQLMLVTQFFTQFLNQLIRDPCDTWEP